MTNQTTPTKEERLRKAVASTLDDYLNARKLPYAMAVAAAVERGMLARGCCVINRKEHSMERHMSGLIVQAYIDAGVAEEVFNDFISPSFLDDLQDAADNANRAISQMAYAAAYSVLNAGVNYDEARKHIFESLSISTYGYLWNSLSADFFRAHRLELSRLGIEIPEDVEWPDFEVCIQAADEAFDELIEEVLDVVDEEARKAMDARHRKSAAVKAKILSKEVH